MTPIDLSLGELAEPLPEAARLALGQAGAVGYAPVAGTAGLRSAVAAHYRRRGLAADQDEVTVSAGGRHGLLAALAAVAAGGEVLMPRPHWSHYPKVIGLAGARPVPVDGDPASGWLADPGRLAASVTPQTRALVINSPVNPTGSVYSDRAMTEIVGWAVARGIHLIVDDMYWAFGGGSIPSAGGLTTVVGGASKGHAMAGLRIGWIWSHHTLAGRIRDVVEHTTGPVSAPGQAAVAAVLGDDAAVAARRQRLKGLREQALELFSRVPLLRPVPPSGGIYLCVDASTALSHPALDAADDQGLCQLLTATAGVRLRAGSTFGLPGYLRLCVAAESGMLREAAQRLIRFSAGAGVPGRAESAGGSASVQVGGGAQSSGDAASTRPVDSGAGR